MIAGRTLRRALVVWLATAVSIAILSWLLGGFEVSGWRATLAMAAIFGLLNSLLWPLLMRYALPLAVFTLGLGVLILNGLLVLAASRIGSDQVAINGLGTAIVVALGITLINN